MMLAAGRGDSRRARDSFSLKVVTHRSQLQLVAYSSRCEGPPKRGQLARALLELGNSSSVRARRFKSLELLIFADCVIFEVEGVEQSLLTLRLTTHHPDALRAWMKLVEQAGLEPQ